MYLKISITLWKASENQHSADDYHRGRQRPTQTR